MAMRKIISASQMREIDRQTSERFGIPSIELMENAAAAVTAAIIRYFKGTVSSKKITVLCGKGNNGGDGAAIARSLAEKEAFVTAILFAEPEETKGDARTNFERLTALASSPDHAKHLKIRNANDPGGIENCDLLVDALFGTGVTRELEAPYARSIDEVNAARRAGSVRSVMSVDIPSGLNADSGDPTGPHIIADRTITFTAPKPANILATACRSNGELQIAYIGSPQELIDETTSQLYIADREDAKNWLRRSSFTDDSYKNKRGHSTVIAGSADYSGAAVLAGNACILTGIGLVTLAAPAEALPLVAPRLLPEIILRELKSETLHDLISGSNAIGIGCGLDANAPGMREIVNKIISERTVPVIADAGALRFLAPPDGIPPVHSGQPPLVLTPHQGEFLQLLGTGDRKVIEDRVEAVRQFAVTNRVIVVLKGERVLIAEPGGNVVVNPTGNSGLGKAGNGDTLTGILTGIVGQAAALGIDIFESVVAAVHMAGMAGDIAEQKMGKRSMLASDVREALKDVFRELTEKGQ